jgi:hypothetical protein
MFVLGFPTYHKVFSDVNRMHSKTSANSGTETCFQQLYFNTASVISSLELSCPKSEYVPITNRGVPNRNSTLGDLKS